MLSMWYGYRGKIWRREAKTEVPGTFINSPGTFINSPGTVGDFHMSRESSRKWNHSTSGEVFRRVQGGFHLFIKYNHLGLCYVGI